MSMLEWARREVEIAKSMCGSGLDEDDAAMTGNCFDSALNAFESICNDGHSGLSISFTKTVLNRLIEGKPLSPIEDTEDSWEEVEFSDDGKSVRYQCKRMSSLFKTVHEDGTVTYKDVDRVIGVSENGSTFHGGRLSQLVDERYPITLPYMPLAEPYKVYTEQFLVYPRNGDYDTEAMLYLITPEGDRVDLNFYWHEKEPHKMVQISREEYLNLKKRSIKQ